MKAVVFILLLSIPAIFLANRTFLSTDVVEVELFQQFVKSYNKYYESEAEQLYRFEIFQENLKVIAALTQANPRAQFGITKFTDISQQEFAKTHLNLKHGEPVAPPLFTVESLNDNETPAPTTWDWRTQGAVTDVKNQGQCGSCWAFSATANIEGQYFLSGSGPLTSFSEQQLVDCDTVDQGCNGGLMTDAFTWLTNNGGQETLADYPYEGVDQKCKFESSKAVAFLKGYFNVSTNETVMAQVLYETGPLSIGVDASSWQFYFGGIYDPLYCGHTLASLDHGVTLVAYANGTDVFGADQPYWVIKNSWGADWGESGYIKIIRNKGECGLNLQCSSSVPQ
jgi:cathepsin F